MMSYLSRLSRRADVSRSLTSLAVPKGILARGSLYREEAPLEEEAIAAPMRRNTERPVRRLEKKLPNESEVATSASPTSVPTIATSSTMGKSPSPTAMREPEGEDEEEKLLTIRRQESDEEPEEIQFLRRQEAEEEIQPIRRQEAGEEEEPLARYAPNSSMERSLKRAIHASRSMLYRNGDQDTGELGGEEDIPGAQLLTREPDPALVSDHAGTLHSPDAPPQPFSAAPIPVAAPLNGIPFHEPLPFMETTGASSRPPQSEVVIEQLDVLIHEPVQTVGRQRNSRAQNNRAMRARYLRRL